MKVMLVSDPSMDKSAAGMVIGVGEIHTMGGKWRMHLLIMKKEFYPIGALNDPKDAPGLANLFGHLIMKKSKKYDGTLDFNIYVLEHDGYMRSLPVTKADSQHFNFEIGTDHLAEALERCMCESSKIIRGRSRVVHYSSNKCAFSYTLLGFLCFSSTH